MVPGIYTTGQVAAILGCSAATAGGLVDRGEVRGFRVPGPGRSRRVPRAALANYLSSHGDLLESLERGEHRPAGVPEGEVSELVRLARAGEGRRGDGGGGQGEGQAEA